MASTNYAAHKPRVNLVNGLRIFFRLGLVRALIGQFVFMFGTMGIMSALGASAEAAWFLGAIVGVLGSLLGSGVIADWLKWCIGRETVLVHGAPADMPEWSRYFGPDVNHKVIGIQYGVASLVVLLVGGLLAVIFRLELSAPGLQFLAAEDYNTIYSAHGIIMIAGILLGVGAMLNYLVPIMIGAHDMAFPRLNAFSFWIAVPSATLLIMAMFVGQGWDSGWTGYPPLSTTGGAAGIFGVQLFLLGFYINGFSSIAGAINILVTVATMRAKGMTLWRMPIFVWAGLSTALLQFTVTQTLAVSLMMVMFQRLFGMNFFNPTVTNVVTGTLAEGVPVGNPLLYQHLFWFYSHPAV
ncbi:MAG: cbb3-type cytochrome c oxidase subunit I, partial [Anaerolineales bacterium]|nr:cbb3-type cytochrome c oxidase subunit I [Anaerolineales bacterium]